MVLTHRDWNRVLLEVAALRGSFADAGPVNKRGLLLRERRIRRYLGFLTINPADIRAMGLRQWAPPQLRNIFGKNEGGNVQEKVLQFACRGMETHAQQMVSGNDFGGVFDQRKALVNLDTLLHIAERAYDFKEIERIRKGVAEARRPFAEEVELSDFAFARYSKESNELIPRWMSDLQKHYRESRRHFSSRGVRDQLPILDNIALTCYLVENYVPPKEREVVLVYMEELYTTAWGVILDDKKGDTLRLDDLAYNIDENVLRNGLQGWYRQHVRGPLREYVGSVDGYLLAVMGPTKKQILAQLERGDPPVQEGWGKYDDDFAVFEGKKPLDPDDSYDPFEEDQRRSPPKTRIYRPDGTGGMQAINGQDP